jgi:hypothetical protein
MAEIAGAELLTRVFGYWPSFHDAEVVRVALSRAPAYREGAFLEADVHAFEMTSDVDERGYFVLRHHVLVSFRFEAVGQTRACSQRAGPSRAPLGH